MKRCVSVLLAAMIAVCFLPMLFASAAPTTVVIENDDGTTTPISEVFGGVTPEVSPSPQTPSSSPSPSPADTMTASDKDRADRAAQRLLSNVIVDSVSQSSINPGSDNRITLNVTLRNTSTLNISKMIVSLADMSSATVSQVDGAGQKIISLASGKTATVSFKLYVNPQILSGNYPITLSTYYGGGETEHYLPRVVYVYIDRGLGVSGTSAATTVPKLIVSSYDVGAKTVAGGNDFMLKYSIKNTSESLEVKNVKISFVSAGNIFTPKPGSTNSVFIDKLGKGASYNGEITMRASSKADTDVYPLEVVMTYEDPASTQREARDMMSVSLTKFQTISVDEIIVPTEINLGEKIPLNIRYWNTGQTELSNLVLHVEGDVPENQKTFEAGILKGGSSGYIDYSIEPQTAGQFTFRLNFSFYDNSGNEFLVPINSYTVKVLEGGAVTSAKPGGQVTPKPAPANDPAGRLGGTWIVLIVLGSLLALGAVGYIVYWNFFNKK